MSNVIVTRESPVLEALEHVKPAWGEMNGMRVAAEAGHSRAIEELAICDASALLKLGLKGRGAVGWLEKHGLSIPAKIFDYASLPGNGFLVRTGTAEFFLEDGPAGETLMRLTESLNFNPPDVHPVWRQDAAFILSGRQTLEVLAQTCGYNFRDSGDAFVMSRVAGVSCSILKQTVNGNVPTFRFWLDCSFGLYLWEELVQIIRELKGEIVGLTCYYPNALNSTGGASS